MVVKDGVVSAGDEISKTRATSHNRKRNKQGKLHPEKVSSDIAFIITIIKQSTVWDLTKADSVLEKML